MKKETFVAVCCAALMAACSEEAAKPLGGAPAEPVTGSAHEGPTNNWGSDKEISVRDQESPEAPVDLSVASAWTTDDLAHVAPGTPAIVRTVVYGTEPTDLYARYLGFTLNPISMGGTDPYLLLETDPEDKRWAGWGGPAAGMSGSPVIIEGRLAGALSFSFGSRREAPFPFIATPVEKMLAVGEDSEIWPDVFTEPEAVPASAVFAVTGGRPQFTERVLKLKQSRFLVPSYLSHGMAGSGRGNKTHLEPGDAIAVNLISGDMVGVSGIGTVTAIDGDRIFAFGHPMFGSGEISLPYSEAVIHGIVDDFMGGSKFGYALSPQLGVITEDRLAAIAGVAGAQNEATTVWTRLVLQSGEMRAWNHSVAHLPEGLFAGDLFILPLLLPLDVAFDRIGPGSAEYELAIAFKESSAVAYRRDITSSATDILEGLIWMVYDVMFQFSSVGQVKITLTNVTLTVSQVSQERRERILFDANAPEDMVVQGENAPIVVKYYRPHGGGLEEMTVEVPVPRGFPEGPATLEVGSLTSAQMGFIPFPSFMGPDPGSTAPGSYCDPIPPPLTVDELVAEFNKRLPVNILEVRLTSLAGLEMGLPMDFPPCEDPMACPPPEPPPFDPCPDPPPPPPSVTVRLETDSVVSGLVSRQIEVISPATE